MKKDYLKSVFNPTSELFELELFDLQGNVIRSYGEAYQRKDAEFICSSYNSREELEKNTHDLYLSLASAVENFKSLKTKYTEYKKIMEDAEAILKKVAKWKQ